MSRANRIYKDSSLKLYNISREKEVDFNISNKIDCSDPLDDRTDAKHGPEFEGSETNGYNHNSRGRKYEEHDYKNQMINLPKLLRQLSLARVVLKRLPISTEATKLRITDDLAPVDEVVVDQSINSNGPRNEHVPPSGYIDDDEESHADLVTIGVTCDSADDAKLGDKLTTTRNGQKKADLIKRNCPKCKITVPDASYYRKQSCAKCNTPLDFQCARCAKQYNNYKRLIYHLDAICRNQNLDMKCTKCDYRAPSKVAMRRHQSYCISGIIYNCKDCKFTTKYKNSLRRHLQNKHEDESSTTFNREKPADLIKRYCPGCKKFEADVSISIEQSCTTCETPLDFQCARCDKQYRNYHSLNRHLDIKCNTQNLDLKCFQCDYRTHAKSLMSFHLNRCLSGVDFNCGLCDYTTRSKSNLLRHMTNTHQDILKVDCSQCKKKPNKCGQCKSRVLICETCHTGFSSTDKFQEHQKSCKQPVLECEYCPFKTHVNNKLRDHIRLEHLNALMSQTLPLSS